MSLYLSDPVGSKLTHWHTLWFGLLEIPTQNKILRFENTRLTIVTEPTRATSVVHYVNYYDSYPVTFHSRQHK